jgi:sulfur carrier protein ThiS
MVKGENLLVQLWTWPNRKGVINMAITFILRKQEIQLEVETTVMVKVALQRLGYSSETHLVLKDGELLNENEPLRDGDRVKLVPVISGG